MGEKWQEERSNSRLTFTSYMLLILELPNGLAIENMKSTIFPKYFFAISVTSSVS